MAALCLSLAVAVCPAPASTSYVDGISDQSIPSWDGGFSNSYFADLFASTWVPGPHIHYARYVLQWNLMSGVGEPDAHYRQQFVAWLQDTASMGLTSDVALTSYNGVYPASASQYRAGLLEILNRAKALGHTISYLEAWNEPNGQGGLDLETGTRSALAAARYTNAANAICREGAGCTIIAGDVEDSPGARAYEERYRAALSPVPVIWGIHPYYSVEDMDESYYRELRKGLPNEGVGDQIWFTEIAARRCTPVKENGEAGQAERAKWLVDTLMRNQRPEHVFYYEFLLKERRAPTCPEFDGALYAPDGNQDAPDEPRAAASYIWSDGETGERIWGSLWMPTLGVATNRL
jgi:hypothetical protein